MAFENSIAETPLDYVVKEYSTVKEYIEHSKNLANRIKEKSAKITEANMVQKDGKEIKEYYTFEEFSTLVEINTVKEFENDNDEIDEIENNGLILPYLYDGYISISNGVTDKETVLEDLTGGLAPNIDEKKAILETFNQYIFANGHVNINIKIQVKAEGLTTHYPQYQDGNYVLDDGTVVEEIDSRR